MRRAIKDLKDKEHIQSAYLVSEKNSGTDRNGKAFLSLTLTDSTGQINARMFEKVEAVVDAFESGDVVWLKGFVQLYQNRRQIIVHDVRRAREDEFSMTDLVAEMGGDPREHLNALMKVIGGLGDKHVSGLLRRTLEDPETREALLRAPAAKTIHHAYRGGLIEHIHSIVKVMNSVADHYPFLSRDLLVFGAVYHDLGKIHELDIRDGIHYTQKGRLVGHMVLACEMIDRHADAMEDFPEDLRDILKHIVLAHHGRLEYGSPKLPMLPEALVVAMIDDLDSKLNTLFHFLKTEVQNLDPREKWSHYHPGFERYFYLDVFRKTTTQT